MESYKGIDWAGMQHHNFPTAGQVLYRLSNLVRPVIVRVKIHTQRNFKTKKSFTRKEMLDSVQSSASELGDPYDHVEYAGLW